MAWRNYRVLLRQLLGKRCNTCRCAGLIHHQHQNYSSLTSIQTLTLTSFPSLPQISAIHVSSASKLLLSHDSHDFLPHRQRYCSAADPIDPTCKELYSTAKYEMLMKKIEDKYPAPAPASASASGTSFLTPSDIVIIWDFKELERALKEVKDGRLSAVFYFTRLLIMHSIWLVTPTIRKLRERFPHVIIYKIMYGQRDMGGLMSTMGVSHSPEFHFYKNGKVVDVIEGAEELDRLIDIFGKLYRCVITRSSSGMGKRRTQQLVVQVKKDVDGNGVEGGRKVASAGTFLQHRGGRTLLQRSGCLGEADESRSTTPSLCQVMQEVESFFRRPYRETHYQYWWFAKGLFKQPEKRVIFSNLKDTNEQLAWLGKQIAEE